MARKHQVKNMLQRPPQAHRVQTSTDALSAAMKKRDRKTPPSVAPYPAETTGSKTAAAVRKHANKWNEETRARLFEQGMQIIYGGSGSATSKVRS